MAGLYSILNTGKVSLATHQHGVNTAGHNIANVNTPGYSRQRAILENRNPFQMRNGYLGQGVDLLTIDRLNGRYIHRQIVEKKSELGYHEKSYGFLREVESVYSDKENADIQNAMVAFFDSFRTLASRPDDLSLRENVRQKGTILTERFHKIDGELTRIQREMKPELDGITKKINGLTTEISKLNSEIAALEHAGHQANDLRDRQEERVRELSKHIQINTHVDNKGFLNINVDSGEALITGKEQYDMILTPATNAGGWDYGIAVNRGGQVVDITHDLRGGELAAMIDIRDNVIEGYKTKLDELATGMSTEVNTIHTAGYGIDLAQRNFFDTDPAGGAIDASSIELHADILASLDAIAAAQNNDPLSVMGDNLNAMAISDIAESNFMDDSVYAPGTANQTFMQYYQNSVAEIGHDLYSTEGKLNYATEEDIQLNAFREQTVGVNMDEELIELNKFQKAYEATSRIIKVADEMLDTIMQLKR